MRYTAEQVQVIISEWQGSGLSKKAFCRERGIVHQTFYNWLRRAGKPLVRGFAEVPVPRSVQCSGCEVIFPSGARLIFKDEPSPSWLREVLR